MSRYNIRQPAKMLLTHVDCVCVCVYSRLCVYVFVCMSGLTHVESENVATHQTFAVHGFDTAITTSAGQFFVLSTPLCVCMSQLY